MPRPARFSDRASLCQLLQAVGLPIEDLPEDPGHFFVLTDQQTVIGSAGMEPYDSVGLLRSVAITPDYRKAQLGKRLIDAIEVHALVTGIQQLYLITTTADGYFSKLGYSPVDRTAVPPAIAATQQFSGLCPSTARVMMKELGAGGLQQRV
ncbi:arsenic resistance N-acetyltransferase ArsN2 [Arsenicibacter rosenii]|nr:arsenic resistance N-acetyltransferase ArsN2 [Arsenicibacter rosenii]